MSAAQAEVDREWEASMAGMVRRVAHAMAWRPSAKPLGKTRHVGVAIDASRSQTLKAIRHEVEREKENGRGACIPSFSQYFPGAPILTQATRQAAGIALGQLADARQTGSRKSGRPPQWSKWP
jgi:hypothetical protein